MTIVGNAQPFSFWVLAAIAAFLVMSTFAAFLTWAQASRRRRWISVASVALTMSALIVMIAPVYVGEAMCGRGAGAPGWLYEHNLAPSRCRWAQWEYFWVGFTLLTLGLGASAVVLVPQFRRPAA